MNVLGVQLKLQKKSTNLKDLCLYKKTLHNIQDEKKARYWINIGVQYKLSHEWLIIINVNIQQ